MQMTKIRNSLHVVDAFFAMLKIELCELFFFFFLRFTSMRNYFLKMSIDKCAFTHQFVHDNFLINSVVFLYNVQCNAMQCKQLSEVLLNVCMCT